MLERCVADESGTWIAAPEGMSAEIPFDVLSLFFRDVAEALPGLRRAFHHDDRAALRYISHRLAGAGGCFGFDALSEVARALELRTDEPDVSLALEVAAVIDACEAVLRRAA